MSNLLIASIILLALALICLSVKIICGKPFVKTHIEQNKFLRDKGITCYQQMEQAERKNNPHQISE